MTFVILPGLSTNPLLAALRSRLEGYQNWAQDPEGRCDLSPVPGFRERLVGPLVNFPALSQPR